MLWDKDESGTPLGVGQKKPANTLVDADSVRHSMRAFRYATLGLFAGDSSVGGEVEMLVDWRRGVEVEVFEAGDGEAEVDEGAVGGIEALKDGLWS